MKAELISIGDEILIGQIVDTNSAWIAAELNMIGVEIVRISSISDSADDINASLTQAMQRADLVILTGGLGPTKDDITKETLTEFFNDKLVLNEEIAKHIASLLARFGKNITELNHQQAMLPSRSIALHNKLGTAPGMWFDSGNNTVVSLPGVPYEMKGIMTNEVLPKLANEFHLPIIVHRTVLTHGMGESWLSESISEWEDALPSNIKLAYLPSPGRVRLRLSAIGQSEENLEHEIEKQINKLILIIPYLIYGYDNDTMEQEVGKLLLTSKATVSTAESCTGGAVAAAITSISGSSDYFKGSVVSYHNDVKVGTLNVERQVIEKQGAVCEDVVKQMAQGVRTQLDTDYALSTSGIAGPTGGTKEKPVGTVWIAVCGPNRTKAKKFQFGDNRERNIQRTTISALNMLRKELLKDLEFLQK